MKFRFGSFPLSEQFEPATNGWKKLKEPALWISMVIAIPVGCFIAAVLAFLWFTATPTTTISPGYPFEFLLLVLATTLIHEFLHAFIHPQFGFSQNTVIGFWPSRGLCYAHYEGQMSRTRFILFLITPFLVLSLFPLLICIGFQFDSSSLAFVSLFNTVAASLDIYGVCLLMRQVPHGALCRNKWPDTFWISETNNFVESGRR